MSEIFTGQIDDPAAWKSSDFTSEDDYSFDLEQRHVDALDQAVQKAHRDGLGLQDMQADHFRLPEIADDLADIRRELTDGRGLILLRGFPLEQFSTEELGIMYWGIGTHFGRSVSQSPMGDRLGYVTDVSKPGERDRGYRSAKELRFHTDSDDVVGLLCIRQAKSGGLSRLVSGLSIHNEIAATRPDLLEPLYQGFHYHWFGEEPRGQPPVTDYAIPVFSWTQGRMSICYLRDFIDMGADERGTPLSDPQVEALDLLESIAERQDFMLEFKHQPGNASFINNYTLLHSRTGFEDWPELERRRLLLRLWLKADPSRAVHPNLKRYYGDDGMFIDGRTSTEFNPDRNRAAGQ